MADHSLLKGHDIDRSNAKILVSDSNEENLFRKCINFKV